MELQLFGKRALCFLLCLWLILIMALPVSAKPAPVPTSWQKTAPVYYRASSSSTLIGCLKDGTQLTVLRQQGQFYQVDCYDMNGYIHQNFVAFKKGQHYVNCSAYDTEATDFIERPISDSIFLQRRLYTLALAQVGVPYVSGGTSPRGFDCSGFTQYIYSQLGISIPRSCDGQLGCGIIIPKENLQCGDLVLFQRTTSQRGITTHVGIYLGDGKLIHAGGRGITVVDLNSSYFTQHYLCARRVIVSDRPKLLLPSANSAACYTK